MFDINFLTIEDQLDTTTSPKQDCWLVGVIAPSTTSETDQDEVMVETELVLWDTEELEGKIIRESNGAPMFTAVTWADILERYDCVKPVSNISIDVEVMV